MNRRNVLRTIAAGSLPLVTGCIESARLHGTDETVDPKHFDGYACPDYDEQSDEVGDVVCYHQNGQDADVRLEPIDRTIKAPEDTVTFVLRNEGDETYRFNPRDWRVDKYVDGEWRHVAPFGVVQPAGAVDPGESERWQLLVDNEERADLAEIERRASRDDIQTVIPIVGLGSGTYTFRLRARPEDERASSTHTAYAAPFEVDGDELELTPTGHVVETERHDDELVLTTEAAEAKDSLSDSAELVVERVDDTEDPYPLFTEALLQRDHLQDAFARLVEDPDLKRVTVETSRGSVRDDRGLPVEEGESLVVNYREAHYELQF